MRTVFMNLGAALSIMLGTQAVAETPVAVIGDSGYKEHGRYVISGWRVVCSSSDNVEYNCQAFAWDRDLELGEVSYDPVLLFGIAQIDFNLFAGDRGDECADRLLVTRDESDYQEAIAEMLSFVRAATQRCEQPALTQERMSALPALADLLLRATEDR